MALENFKAVGDIPRLNEAEVCQPVLVLDVDKFSEAPDNLIDGPIAIQMKGFNRLDRIKRQTNEIKIKGRSGSTDIRPISDGAVMFFDELPKDRYLDLHSMSSIHWTRDSRGMYFDSRSNSLFVGQVDEVTAINVNTQAETQIVSSAVAPLAFVHSMDMSPDGRKLLLASSGFDLILEIDLETKETGRFWVARDEDVRNGIVDSGQQLLGRLVDKSGILSSHGGLGLPPAQRKVFPNGITYLDDDRILATFFHDAVAEINLSTGATRQLDLDVKHPHSPLRFGDGVILSDTANGRAIVLNHKLENTAVVNFANLPILEDDSGGRQWLQHIRPLKDNNTLIAVDSNRESLFALNLESQSYNRIRMNKEWVVQEALVL